MPSISFVNFFILGSKCKHLLNIRYFVFPGSVLYRWDVEERKVTSQCDISTLVPLGDENASCVTQGKISGA